MWTKILLLFALVPVALAQSGAASFWSSNALSVPAFPDVDAHWTFWNPANLCGVSGSTAPCTSGSTVVYSLADLSGHGNTATTAGTSQPTYVPSALNGKAAGTFATGSWFSLASSIPTAQTQYTFYVVFERTGGAGSFLSGANGSLSFADGSSTCAASYCMAIGSTGTGSIAHDTTTLDSTNYHAAVITFNKSTLAYQFYFCGSVCTLSSSGTGTSQTLNQAITTLGNNSAGTSPLLGDVVDVAEASGIASATDLAKFARYVTYWYGNLSTVLLTASSCGTTGTQYVAYSGCTLSASGGTAPYTYGYTQSTSYTTPPEGLSIGSGGSITGTVYGQGTYSPQFVATDSLGVQGTLRESYSITGDNTLGGCTLFPSDSIFHTDVSALPVDTSPSM